MDGKTRQSMGSNEPYHGQVHESIKGVFEMTARIDERVQLMMKKQDDLDNKIDSQMNLYSQLSARVTVLESDSSIETLKSEVGRVQDCANEIKTKLHDVEMKLQNVEGSSGRQEDRWKNAFNFIVQIIWVIVAGYLLYKLGLPSP
jgi:predicted  nucleic acid-binding Zn-ribbon protein